MNTKQKDPIDDSPTECELDVLAEAMAWGRCATREEQEVQEKRLFAAVDRMIETDGAKDKQK